jgi:hypothetical protein
MKCPNCKLENPPTTERCDCGYDFRPSMESKKHCPFCAELIQRAAVVCRYCNRELVANSQSSSGQNTVHTLIQTLPPITQPPNSAPDKQVKKKSLPMLGWLGFIGAFLFFIVLFIIFTDTSKTKSTSTENKSGEILITTLDNGTKAAGDWETSVTKDEMTGEKAYFAQSKNTSPTEKMDFPYHNVEAWLGIVCNGKKERAGIGFTESPNLVNTDIHDGYNLVNARIKWDDKV